MGGPVHKNNWCKEVVKDFSKMKVYLENGARIIKYDHVGKADKLYWKEQYSVVCLLSESNILWDLKKGVLRLS